MSRLRIISVLSIVLTFGLIILGAWVRATNSGLSCPDWPTCYGYWVPLPADIPADAGYHYYQVMLEWVHRLIAGVFVGPLVLAMAWLCWRHRERAAVLPVLGIALVVLLAVQVTLGAVTVLDQNSPWSVAVHKTTALLLFAVMWLVFERSADRPTALTRTGLAPHAALGWLLLLGTIASAAVMSKSGASLACASPFLCNDSLLPAADDPLERLHMIHRGLAFITFITLAILGFRVRREPRLRGLDRMIGLLLVIQIILGMLTVVYEVPIGLALAHQANGILLFAHVTLLLARILLADRTEPLHAQSFAAKTMTSTSM